MKKYRVYRSMKSVELDQIDWDQVGISWAQDESNAEMHADQFMEDYIILSATISPDQINIPQTNAQWESEHANECEVVLKEYQDITVEYQGKKYKANTGGVNEEDETRPDPIKCDPAEITDYLEQI